MSGSAAPTPPLRLATIVGEFEVAHEIGRGSFATVFLARHRPSLDHHHNNNNNAQQHQLQQQQPSIVAVKTVNREKLNRKLAENLESEIKILRGIRHDNIVHLLDIVKTEKHIHLVMEYCSMGDLSMYIKKRGLISPTASDSPAQIPPTTASTQQASDPSLNPLAGAWGGLNDTVVRHYLRQIASAIEFLRSQSLIHRDLKPQNLLLNPPSPNSPQVTLVAALRNLKPQNVAALPILKLADFGFARALPQQSLASTLCGSPLYMAPEILRGDRYDAKADLWSLGAILYELVTGRPPFKAQNHVELLRRIDRGEGHIRFPGEEPDSRRGSSNAAIAGGVAASLPRTAGGALAVAMAGNAAVVGSLGSSPRFPSAMANAIPIAEDIKDLIRCLLKRNPVERMSFEEFFMHPCVVASAALAERYPMLVPTSDTTPFQIVPEKARTAESPTRASPIVSPVSSVPKSLKGPGPRTSSESLRQMQEAAALNASRQRGSVDASIQQWGQQQQQQDAQQRQLRLQTPETMPQPMDIVTTGPLSSRRISVGSPKSINLTDIEPPFAGYDVDPAALFRGLDTDERTFVLASPMALNAVEPDALSTPTVVQRQPVPAQSGDGPDSEPTRRRSSGAGNGDRDPLSSLSSLGSLELSEDGDESERIVHIVRKGNGNDAADSSANQSAGGIKTITGANGDRRVPSEDSKSRESSLSATRKTIDENEPGKRSFDDFVVVEKRGGPVEVNWIARDSSPPRGSGGVSDQNQQSRHPVGPVTPAASPRDEGFVPHLGEYGTPTGQSYHGVKDRERVGVAVPGVPQRATSPFGSPGAMGSGTTPPSPRLLGSGRDSSGKGRVFGSLRDSTHNFLASSSPIATFLPNTPTHQQYALLHQQTTPQISGQSPYPRYQHPSLPSQVPEEEATSLLLTSLNLHTIRGHSLNILAVELQSLAANPPPPEVAEEILNMYLAALTHYQRAIEAAQTVHSRGARGVDVGSLAAAVSWVRMRFSDALDRAAELRAYVPDDGNHPARPVEKIVYFRACEVARSAWSVEVAGELEAAESGYLQAVVLVEAVLDGALHTGGGGAEDDGAFDANLSEHDRAVLERFLGRLSERITRIRELRVGGGGGTNVLPAPIAVGDGM